MLTDTKSLNFSAIALSDIRAAWCYDAPAPMSYFTLFQILVYIIPTIAICKCVPNFAVTRQQE